MVSIEMRIGAIIINWNSFEQLYQSLAAIVEQTRPFDRVIVVDNGSKNAPESLDVELLVGLEYIRLSRNIGFAAANNLAMSRLSDCDLVALINPDAYLKSDWLDKMEAATAAEPDCASFASVLVMANDRARFDGVGDVYHFSGLVWRDLHGKDLTQAKIPNHEVFSACAAAALYRRKAFVEVSGFDEDFFCYVEDVDLGFRLRLMGYRCMLVPTASAYHIGSATTGGRHSSFSVYYGQRNLVWAYVKNMPALLFWTLLPLHILINVASMTIYALKGRGAVFLRAKLDAIKGIPKMWRKRRQIQANRVASVASIWRILDKRLWSRRY